MISHTVSRDLVDHPSLTQKMIKIIEEKIEEDDETTASQIVKLLEDKGYNISRTTVIRARKALGWNFHGRRYVLPDVTN